MSCPTVRRLRMVKQLSQRIFDPTSRALVERLTQDWFHCGAERFSRQLPERLTRKRDKGREFL